MADLGPIADLRVLAFLFAEQIVIDPQSLRRSLIGLFDVINPPLLPYRMEKLNLFILPDTKSRAVGKFSIIVRAPSGELIAHYDGCMAEWASRTCECELTLYDIVFPMAGDYTVQVCVGERVGGERLLPVAPRTQSRF